jgi:predicted N-acetyltransferase YhbS
LIEIREEHPVDIEAIRDLNRRTFGQDQEGNIVDAFEVQRCRLAFLGGDAEWPSRGSHYL